MRLRNIPGADDVIKSHPIAVKNEKEYKETYSGNIWSSRIVVDRFCGGNGSPSLFYS